MNDAFCPVSVAVYEVDEAVKAPEPCQMHRSRCLMQYGVRLQPILREYKSLELAFPYAPNDSHSIPVDRQVLDSPGHRYHPRMSPDPEQNVRCCGGWRFARTEEPHIQAPDRNTNCLTLVSCR